MTDMTGVTNPTLESASITLGRKTWPQRFWEKRIQKLLNSLDYGRFSLVLPNGHLLRFEGKPVAHGEASIILHSFKPVIAFFLRGELAFAESYLKGEWSTPNLTDLFHFVMANEKAFMDNADGNVMTRFIARLGHLRNANTREGSRKNISFHYDLGNSFYEQWLDPSMTYSSALYEEGTNCDLKTAQICKYRKIADMAELKSNETVLEIGCGWGGFSELAAKEYDCSIHGLTLSSEQLTYARERYKRQGLDNAAASLVDYRDSTGTYDKIVSIEMFEAVGYEFWAGYFQTIWDRLKPGGVAVLQVILIDDQRFDSYRKNVDFIQKYIFPGGLLPGQKALSEAIENQGLTLEDTFLFGQSYAKTCAIWQENFLDHWSSIEPLGFDDRFKRMWSYYLSYCEAGFEKGSIDVGLFKIRKPG